MPASCRSQGDRVVPIDCSAREADGPVLDPDEWLTRSLLFEGSWWPAWSDWFKQHSGEAVTAPSMGAPDKNYPVIADAPGHYVLER